MAILTLDQFLPAHLDLERAQYEILARLQRIRKAFAQNRIYPHLSDLEDLATTLDQLLERSASIREALPTHIRSIDWEKKEVIREQAEEWQEAFFLEDLIRWARPLVQELIEEGHAIQAFVEENIQIEEVGIVPSYRDEGYFILPELKKQLLHIFAYHLSLFTHRGRSMRVQRLKSLKSSRILISPHSIKLELVWEHRELPNPATYLVESEIDFPFEATLLPVAKRKLQRYLLE